ncbi:MAG: branched-chain-amino-acid transaminase [Chloroflexi bacterium RBG_16_48_7]|nr:MAG: branched-chain-amino-acid transaminase [Chloroflexi bacterium RBG_16_48_7]
MPPYAYFHKKFMPLADAKINVLTHAMHYGTACFEGIRGNYVAEDKEMYLFRLKEHYERFHNGCKILKMEMPAPINDLIDVTVELVKKSGFKEDVYIRPIAFKSAERVGVRLHDIEDDYAIVVLLLPAYLDTDKGVRCCVSSWRRHGDSMIPSRGKISGAYVISALAKSEAMERGFDEAILCTDAGNVSEGSGENLFMITGGKLVTPPGSDGILLGITRDTIMEIAEKELGMETLERSISRSDLYIADEVFLTGTAAHCSPVVEIDEYKVGNGKPGKITKKLQQIYFDVIRGKNPKYIKYCTPVFGKTAKKKSR